MAKKFEFNAKDEQVLATAQQVLKNKSLQDTVAKMKESHLSVSLKDGDHVSFPAGVAVIRTFDAEVKKDGKTVLDKNGRPKTEKKEYFAFLGSVKPESSNTPRDLTGSVNAFLREDFATVLRDADGNEVTEGNLETDDLYLHRNDFRSRFGEAKITFKDVIIDGETATLPVLEEDIEFDIVTATVYQPDYDAEDRYDKEYKRYTALVARENYAFADL
jgi:hypothetical protein